MNLVKNEVEWESSRILGGTLEELFTLKNFPVHMMKSACDACCDMVYAIGKSDGFIQLKKTIPLKELYIDTHSNAIGTTWKGAHLAVASELEKVVDNVSEILEIGGGTGQLNKLYNVISKKKYFQWDIVEPQPCPVKGCTANYIKGFFPDAIKNKRYDVLLHTHVIEHMTDLHSFMQSLCKCIKLNGRMIFSLPDMYLMMKNRVTSILNFEHNFLLTEDYVDYLLGRYGFEIKDKIRYGNGHSLIYNTVYIENVKDERYGLTHKYDENKKMFMEYICSQQRMVEHWNEKIARENRKIFLFGAHISTQYFAAYGLKLDKIEAILDNDQTKQGQAVSGIDKDIYSPQILKNMKNVVIIMPNNPYRSEIEKNILETINSDVEFWE